MEVVIETRGLRKSFGKVHAVRGIDLTVKRGSIYGLIGPNGAGKSTTLRMLVDIIRPDDGTVSVLGEAPRMSKPELRRRIGYLPGEIRLTERISGESVLEHFASISGPVAPGTIQELAERLELDLHRPVRALSKGNRQKLGLIQAFMHRPELLILDEPTSGLDPLMQREFLSMIREAQGNGQTVLLSSHILGEIQHAADAAAVLARGTIVAEGDIASLRLRGSSRLRAVLEGSDAQRVQAALEEVVQLTDLVVREAGDQLIQVSGLLRGEPDSVVKILARHTIRDLTLEEPDLEESILELYENTETQS
ncbi:ABC transporter ATP-binding protein [Buchananella hordeovulneris]|uniref:ABC transporter ATP-binding protein n=1 Tax=Buchananella hordeovulneris TaxID=52770 RepID=UPI000F5D971B|nr:ABC transporter ATP-binding protein [Buchananella hordeovulneris]RRD42027.1 ABC transporter ATP-binding protein [Buchananella hordeovulneris]